MENTAAFAPVQRAGAPARSPFEGHATGNRPNAAGRIGVQLTASMLPSFTLISTWTGGLPGLLEALTTVFGDTVPQRVGKTTRTEFGLLARSGPQEFLLVGDDTTDRTTLLRASVGTETGTVTDLSHARCCIHIEGAPCGLVLGTLFELDLSETALAIGDVAMTDAHPAPTILHRLGLSAFDLYVWRTCASEQLTAVLDAAQEHGVALQSA